MGLYENMSAYDNLDFYGKLYDRSESQRKQSNEYFLKMLGLWEKRDAAAGTFSKGMKQKLAVARALIHDPQVLFLDEPTANLDPESAKTDRDNLLELKKENKTNFLNTHTLDEARRICDRIAILNTRLMAVGTAEELERTVKGRQTVIQLARAGEAVGRALERLSLGNLSYAGAKATFDVADPG